MLVGTAPTFSGRCAPGPERISPGWRGLGDWGRVSRLRGGALMCARAEEPEAEKVMPPGFVTPLASAETAVVPKDDPIGYSPLELLPTDADAQSSAVGQSSLRGSILSCGVKTATSRYDLPAPQVAVRNLAEQAQFAHLCTIMSSMHHRRAGYPFGTLVDFVTDGAGFPIFSLSRLALPSKNLQEDSRCSLIVQMPGWTGLANARVTVFGDVYPLPIEMHAQARELFQSRHAKRENVLTGNTVYFRMHNITDIYFVGGFGTVQWIDVADYILAQPDKIVQSNPHHTLHVLNETFEEDLRGLFSSQELPVDDVCIISIDAIGADIRMRVGAEFAMSRLGFDMRVHNVDEAILAVESILSKQT